MEREAPMTIGAWQYTSTSPTIEDNLVWKSDIPQPSLTKPGTLVQVLAVALNPADYKVPEIPLFGRLAVGAPPQTPAQDIAGRVVNSTTSELAPGDLVVGSIFKGALAEYVFVPANRKGIVLAKVPQALASSLPERDRFPQLSGFGVAGLTALNALASLPKGGSVVVVGASGGVGHLIVQIAKAQGAKRVVGISSGKNAGFVRSMGADNVLDYTAEDDVPLALANLTQGAGNEKFDLVLDTIASDGLELYFRSHGYLKDEGVYRLIGGGMSLSAIVTVSKAMMLPGFLGGGRRKFEFFFQPPTNQELEKLLALAAEGKVKVVIDEVFPKDAAVAAFRKIRSGRAKGKVCVSMED
jgi:NADPH:quinone reductase-like Zn-dependent oxidoreductase